MMWYSLRALFVAPYLEAIRKNTQRPNSIYRAHNIEHQVWEKLALQKSDPFKKIFALTLRARIKNYELAACLIRLMLLPVYPAG
jgi:hypothetical protein